MVNNFTIQKTNKCGIVIQDDTVFLPDEVMEDYGVVYIIQQMNDEDFSIVLDRTYLYKNSPTPGFEFELPKDGLFNITSVLVEYRTEGDESLPDGNFYTDGNNLFKAQGGILIDGSYEELLDATLGTGLKVSKNIFTLCKLKACLAYYANILMSLPFGKCAKNLDQQTYRFNRDYLLMAINVIQYNVDLGQLNEATRLLTKINQCNVMCESLTDNLYDCGCNS